VRLALGISARELFSYFLLALFYVKLNSSITFIGQFLGSFVEFTTDLTTNYFDNKINYIEYIV